MEDKKIVCKDCGKEFIFTVGEQEFYKEKGFENDPVRCPECRKARKAQKVKLRGYYCSSFLFSKSIVFI